MALKRIWIASPNYSSRAGSGVRLIVVHTAEGATTIENLGSWFQNPSSGVSSHTGADDKPGTIGEYVRPENKAWTQGNYNPVCVSIELCGFASWSTDEWHRHPNMLANCAAWIAEEAGRYQLPITKLTSAQAQGSSRGVCGHVDLGAGGGGHWDPGPDFPWDYVLDLARSGAQPTPTPPEDTMAIAATQNADGRAIIAVETKDGSVKHIEQNKPNGDWWKNADGSWKWLGLGNPSK
jgi:hypothetical protein